jgi:hypothetical protein
VSFEHAQEIILLNTITAATRTTTKTRTQRGEGEIKKIAHLALKTPNVEGRYLDNSGTRRP